MNFLNLFSGLNLKEIIQQLPDAVLVVNEEGRIIWANREAEFMFGIDMSEEVDYYLDDFVSNGTKLADQSASRRTPVIAGAITKDEKEFFIELNTSQLEDQFLITIRDVTAMTKVLANAEKTGQLNKDKNIMLTKLSHDFKSPLQSIIGFSTALIDGLGGDITEKQAKYVKIINKNASELLYFMEKFFEFSKAESSLVRFELKTFDIVNTVQEIIKSNESSISNKKIEITLDYEELANRPITTDESVIKTVLQNILEISNKLTEIGSINIKLSNPDLETIIKRGVKVINNAESTSYILISIKDTGMGLKETELEGLFEPYTQLEKSSRKNFVRTVSLGTAKTLINKLNGTIWVESEVMKGTTFNIVLPIEKGIILEDE